MLFDAFELLQFKAILLLTIWIFRVVDLAEEHFERPHPQSAVAVQFPVDDNRRARFGVVRHILHQIIVALEVSVDSF